jgi:hypothetical protein
VRVGVRLDPGRDAQQHRLAYATLLAQRVEPSDFLEVVDDHSRNACIDRHGQLVGPLLLP